VLVVAASEWLGVSRLPRVLAAAGARVSLLAHPASRAARSRHVHELIAGSWDPAQTVERLRERLDAGAAYDWILLADDPTAVEAVRRRGETWLKGWFPVDPASDKAPMLTSKARFFEGAAAAGLPIPRTRSASTAAEIRAAAKELGFPILIKPAEGVAGTGVFTAADAAELERKLPADGAFVAQSFIPGRSGGTAALFDGGRPAWWFSSLRDRVWPEPYGPSCRRRLINPPEIPAMLEKLGALLGLRGLVELEWILPEGGGGPLIIEMNPRPPSYLYLADEMGAGLTAALRAFLPGGASASPAAASGEGVAALFPEDAVRAAAQRDWRACAGWLTGRAGAVPWDDPRLLGSYGWLVAKSFIRPLLYGHE
jgi:predicted ATP-grasp superfamily ATP-dependent carboligase